MAASGLAARVGTAVVLLPTSLALVMIPQLRWGFVLFVAALACIAMSEFVRMVEAKRTATDGPMWVAFAGLIAFLGGQNNFELSAGALVGLAIVSVAALVIRGKGAVASLSAAVLGLVYLGWFPAHLVMLHGRPDGDYLVLMLLVSVVLTDAGAYFVGKRFGKRKLAPKVSPNKTWEGAIGGLVCAAVGMVALRYGAEALGARTMPILPLIAVGIALSVTSQIGDLAESALKRDAGMKDSGAILPGHGGVMDRCDGFLFASPVLYYMASFF